MIRLQRDNVECNSAIQILNVTAEFKWIKKVLCGEKYIELSGNVHLISLAVHSVHMFHYL